jgi:hypothetical protein
MDRLSTSLITETQRADLCQTALDLAIKICMWLYTVNEKDGIGRSGNRIKVYRRSIVTLSDHDSVHCRQNLHVDLVLRDTEMIEKLNLSGNGSPAVRTHRRYDKRLCFCVSKPLTGCAHNNREITDAATADCDRDSHARFDDAPQPSQLAPRRGRRVVLDHAPEDLTHQKQARERRHERESSGSFKEIRD